MVYTSQITYRGDTVIVPISTTITINPLATYKIQVRKKPDSFPFYTGTIEGSNMIIATTDSINFTKGIWYVELEENLEGVVTTLQRTILVVMLDITINSELLYQYVGISYNDNASSLVNITLNQLTDVTISIVPGFNYLFLAVPEGLNIQILNEVGFDISDSFSIVDSINNKNIFRSDDVFYTESVNIFKIKIY